MNFWLWLITAVLTVVIVSDNKRLLDIVGIKDIFHILPGKILTIIWYDSLVSNNITDINIRLANASSITDNVNVPIANMTTSYLHPSCSSTTPIPRRISTTDSKLASSPSMSVLPVMLPPPVLIENICIIHNTFVTCMLANYHDCISHMHKVRSTNIAKKCHMTREQWLAARMAELQYTTTCLPTGAARRLL